MGVSKPRTSGGIHSMVAVNRTTGVPYGILPIIKGADVTFDRAKADLFAGTNPGIIDTLYGKINSSVNVTFVQFEPFLYTLAGYTVVSNAAEAAGSVSALVNLKGTSVSSATTGVVISLASGKTSDLKRGRYMMVAASASTVNIYAVNDNDFLNGTTALSLLDNNLKITSSALSFATATEVVGLGVSIVKGSGTTALVTGDCAYFDVKPINLGSYKYTLSGNPKPVEFDMYIISQVKANGEYFVDRYPRAVFSSIPGSMTEDQWTESQINITTLYDNTLQASYIREDVVLEL